MIDDFEKALAFHQGDAPEKRKKLEQELNERLAAEKAAAQLAADRVVVEKVIERKAPSGAIKPGETRNPHGVSKLKKSTTDQIIQLIKDETNDGTEMIHRLLRFARNGDELGLSVKDQIDLNWRIIERLIGKTPNVVVSANVTGHPALEQIATREDLLKLALLEDDEEDAEVVDDE